MNTKHDDGLMFDFKKIKTREHSHIEHIKLN